jgi:4'-phosphopantetheinyl transferase
MAITATKTGGKSGAEMLPRDEVHLWVVFLHEVPDGPLLEQYRALLTEEERQKEARFQFEKHRRQYVITRALIRTVLSGYSGLEPRCWRFATSAYGRPQVRAPSRIGGLSFNLAHTDDLIVCACSRSGLIGVDAEYVIQDRAPLDIAHRYFSPTEVAELNSAPSEARAEHFFQYWTLKESYIKAVGAGLAIPMDQFSFTLARAGYIGISFHGSLIDDPQCWRFWLLKPAAEHLIAVCAERSTAEAQKVVTRRVVPLVFAEPFETRVIAQSY